MLKNRLNIGRNSLTEQIRVSSLEINRIDSLAKLSYLKDNIQQLRFDQNKLLLGDQQKQLFYNDLLRLQDRISYAKGEISKYNKPVELPSGFVVSPGSENGMFKYGVLSIIFGIILSIIVVFVIDNLSKITKYLKN